MRSAPSILAACWGLALVACGIPVQSQMLELPSYGSVGGPQNECEREAFVGTALTSASAQAVLPQRSQERIGPNLIKYTQNDEHGGASAIGYALYRAGSDDPMQLSSGLRLVSSSLAAAHERSPAAMIRARLDRQARWGKWIIAGLATTVIGAGVAIAGVTSESSGLVGPGLAVMGGGLLITVVGTGGALSNGVQSPHAASSAVVDGVVYAHADLPSHVERYNHAVRGQCQLAR